MPDTYAAEPRTVLGKGVGKLRRAGVLPANVYGRGLASVAVQLPTRDARALLTEHGTNTLVQLQVAGERASRPVVVRHVQRHPVSHELQHLDFYQVNLTQTMQAEVPVVIVGEAPAVQRYQGVVLHGADTVLVEALPENLPQHLEVSIDELRELDAQVTVADVQFPAGVTPISPPDLMLARVARPRVVAEDAEAVPEGEQPAAAAPAAEGEASSG